MFWHRRGKEADIALFLQVTKIIKKKKIRKNLRSKLVDDLPKLSNEPNETQKQTKRVEIHQWTLSSKHMFPMRFAKMIDGTEKRKISSKNKFKLILGDRPSPFYSSNCLKFLFCCLWFRQTQTLSKQFSAWFYTQTLWFLIYIL